MDFKLNPERKYPSLLRMVLSGILISFGIWFATKRPVYTLNPDGSNDILGSTTAGQAIFLALFGVFILYTAFPRKTQNSPYFRTFIVGIMVVVIIISLMLPN